MNRQLPYMALDGVLCDRPQDGCYISGKHNYARDNISNTTKKETTKIKTMSTSNVETYTRLFLKDPAAANRYWARCMGQDSSMDDETIEKLKGFLKNKLSAEDHEQVCNMLAGEGAAQDTSRRRMTLTQNRGASLLATRRLGTTFSRVFLMQHE